MYLVLWAEFVMGRDVPEPKVLPQIISPNYSRTSMARTLMARLPRLFRTRSSVLSKTNPWLQICDNLV